MTERSGFDPQDLAALIGSRLCHDLVNPLGAIGNGVELIEMTGSANGPELDLVRDAVRDAQARIKYLRVAFGAAGPDQSLGQRETAAALHGLFQGSRMRADWQVADTQPRAQVKLAFLMVLCAETALPMGADLTVSKTASGQWKLSARSDRVQMEEDLWSVLRFGPTALDRPLRPAEVQFAALHALAEALDLTINYVRDADGLTMITA